VVFDLRVDDPLHSLTEDEWQQVHETVLEGPWQLKDVKCVDKTDSLLESTLKPFDHLWRETDLFVKPSGGYQPEQVDQRVLYMPLAMITERQ